MTSPAIVLSTWRTDVARLRPLLPFVLFAVIGIELMTLVAWLPDTFRVWWNVDDVGDFAAFYKNASSSSPTNLYSTGLTLLMRPLTWLEMTQAFRVYFAINVAATLGVAYLAQRGVRSIEARVAVFLGVIALPQTQWVLRTGHFSMVLAFFALSGFLLTERRPVLAGVCFAMLALKPQYLPVPILYLLWSRNRQALLGAGGTLLLLSVAGLVTVGVDPFVAQIQRILNASLDHSAVYLPAQQAWQYSWQGVLISAGIEPNPALTIDLMVLSLGAVVLAWAKATPSAAKVAAALGMLLLAPYATFYNWSMITVAAALLLRSDLRPRALIPLLLAGGVIAAAATQKATPYPSPNLLTAGTYGLYWLPPFALFTTFALALAGRRRSKEGEPAEAAAPQMSPSRRPRLAFRPKQLIPQLPRFAFRPKALLPKLPHLAFRPKALLPKLPHLAFRPKALLPKLPRLAFRPKALLPQLPRLAIFTALALAAFSSGYVVSAFVSHNGPFKVGPFDRQRVLEALPADFPLPGGSTIEDAGRGTLMPYRIEWQSAYEYSEVASLYRSELDKGDWEIGLEESAESGLMLRAMRFDISGEMDLFAEIQVAESDGGSTIQLEFILLPVTNVPGFDEWLADREANQQSDALGEQAIP